MNLNFNKNKSIIFFLSVFVLGVVVGKYSSFKSQEQMEISICEGIAKAFFGNFIDGINCFHTDLGLIINFPNTGNVHLIPKNE